MNYWIFIVTDHKDHGLTANEIYTQRMQDRFWGLGERTPNRKNLSEGDKVVFYIGSSEKNFAGTATLSSSCIELNDSEKKRYGHDKEFYTSDFGVLLKDINAWSMPKAVKDLVPQLNFIENKDYWFAYFQGGISQIEEGDFKIITGERPFNLVDQIKTAQDLESQSEFALEDHLEEFIYQNWSKINWGSKLELYEVDDQNGRQFPAATWRIDFLAVDKETGDLIVIELKRGKTSDSTVGQILRYINWVNENIAKANQNVRGIIIAGNIDESLKYSVKNLNNLKVKTYKVNFQLFSPLD